MQRIINAVTSLKQSGSTGLMAHMIAGFPNMDESLRIGQALAAHGATVLEIQVPFSDPVADGPDIQHASSAALIHGYAMSDYLQLIADVRRTVSIPIVVMTYTNPAFSYGISRFAEHLAANGADGVIIPDLPMEEDEGLADACAHNGLALIPVAAPGCTDERIASLARYGSGFLYTAVRSGITGAASDISSSAHAWLSRVAASSSLPLAVGFGINNAAQVKAVSSYATLAVAGSVIVRAVTQAYENGTDCAKAAGDIVERLLHESDLP